MCSAPTVQSFFDEATATWSHVVYAQNSTDKRCAIIDSVLDFDLPSGRTATIAADKIIAFIQEKKLQVEWLLETHIHADHLTAAAYLKNKLGGKTGISRAILDVLRTWAPILQNTADTPQDGRQFDQLFFEGDVFSIGPFNARVLHVPGHTPADTAFLIGDALFVGDALFMPDVGTGRCDFPGGSAADSYASIQKILALPAETRIFVGHDYPPTASARAAQAQTSVAEEKEKNIRVGGNKNAAEYIEGRIKDDAGKPVPKLLFPALQVNLRAGHFGADENGVQFIKIPLNKI